MKKLLLSALVVLSSVSLIHGMQCTALNQLEKALVLKEIERRGVEAIGYDVDATGEVEFIGDSKRFGWQFPIALTIKAEFNKNDSNSDVLTHTIFETIAQREAQFGYGDDFVIGKDGSVQAPVNCLSDSLETRYYWNTDKSGVRVEALLRNKLQLQQLISEYKAQHTK